MSPENTPSALASIKFLSDPLAGKTFCINKPINAIGRYEGNDIVIDDLIVLLGNQRGRTRNSQAAMHRLLLAWGFLGAIIVAQIIVICIGLKLKDVRK